MPRSVLFVLAGLVASPASAWAAPYRTTNFLVHAPTPHIAEQVGKYAENYRREKALQWLGQEMAAWPEPCPVRVTVTMNGAGGATEFKFANGQVIDQRMHIEGSLERLLNSVLPHEVTHTVFAYHFRRPLPRWADEGGAVLSEDEVERRRHDTLVRQALSQGRAFTLRMLFSLRDYPTTHADVMSLYAEGFSVVEFLVGQGSRPAFLAFLAQGMQEGWDKAVQQHYRYKNVEDLEQAWLAHLRNTRGQLASNTRPADGEAVGRVVVRQTAPPAQPTLEAPQPLIRGQAPDAGDEAHRSQGYRQPDWSSPASYQAPPAQPDRWQPSQPGQVRLGAPEYVRPAPAQLGRPAPVSPVGYPR
jgi:hypothetical protein